MKTHLGFIVLFVSGFSFTLLAGCGEEPTGADPTGASAAARGRQEDSAGLNRGGQLPFSAVQLFIEHNATAGDAGIQVFFDAEAWQQVKISDPDDREILDMTTRRGFRELGLTEVRFESDEPSPAEVLALFAAGDYEFSGRTLEGDRLTGVATLSHTLPAAPSFTPANGEIVDPGAAVIDWDPVPGADVYQVIVENDDLGVGMTVDLLGSTTSLQVPPTFLEPGREYKVEVLAIAGNGNRTITEGTFNTAR